MFCGIILMCGCSRNYKKECKVMNKIKFMKRILDTVSRQNNRAKLAGNEHGLTVKQWIRLLVLSDGKCVYCQEDRGVDGLVLEHIVPVVHGGGTTWDNVVPACPKCNSEKHAKTPLEWAEYKKRAARVIKPRNRRLADDQSIKDRYSSKERYNQYRQIRAKLDQLDTLFGDDCLFAGVVSDRWESLRKRLNRHKEVVYVLSWGNRRLVISNRRDCGYEHYCDHIYSVGSHRNAIVTASVLSEFGDRSRGRGRQFTHVHRIMEVAD